jgi:recombination protein RecT
MTTTTQTAVATRDNSPSALVERYKSDFTAVLPSHVKPDTWVRLAVGVLRRDPKIAEAAANNVGAFMAALLTAARLGLEPGTEQYYLTPRKVKGRLEILGITGYQGIIELMYRAGAVSSVIVENVYSNDQFRYAPGRDERPLHEIDWDASDRGALRLVYAYAVMKDGATSKVVVLNRADIDRIKKKSASAAYDSSPWNTDEAAMWMKSAARQLGKWVPTSAEYVREQLRAQREVAAESTPAAVMSGPVSDLPTTAGLDDGDDVHYDPETGEVIEAELVDDDAASAWSAARGDV